MNGSECADERDAGDVYEYDADSLPFSSLAAWLSELRKESEAVPKRAVTSRGRLMQERRIERPPDLSKALNAVMIYEGLAERNPAVYLPDLARSLSNLSDWLVAAGRRDEAVVAAERAVTIRERLAELDPTTHLLDLARSLSTLSIALARLGHDVEGLAAVERAVMIYEGLADRNPAAYLPDLARSLNNLSIGFTWVGRYGESVVAAEWAVRIYEGLAEWHAAAYLHDLSTSVNNLADARDRLGEDGRCREGRTAASPRALDAAPDDRHTPAGHRLADVE